MGRALISSENSLLRNALGILLCIFIVPVAIIAKLLVMPFERPISITIDEVLIYLNDFMNDSGDAYSWDDFISIPIKNPDLEGIRRQAIHIPLPLTEEGKVMLMKLISETEALKQ